MLPASRKHFTLGITTSAHKSQKVVKDATYIRLKNVEIGYTFRKLRITKNTGIASLRVYANGLNLYTWDRMGNGSFDPEAPSGKGFFYPQLRVVNFGISADF